MTFPTIPTSGAGRILSVNNTAGGATKTSPNLSSLTKNAGDLLIAIVVTYDGNSTNAEFSSWGGSFTEFADRATTTTMGIGAAYKWSTGSETGTFTVTTADTSANDSTFIILSIPGAHASTPPEAGAKTDGTSSAANVAALNPTGWDVEDTLWIAVAGSGEDSTTGSFTGVTASPTNYGSDFVTSITADVVGGVNACIGFRQLAAASEDPATFTTDTSSARNSNLLIAIPPVPPPNDGDATGAVGWAGSADGVSVHAGSSMGAIGWVGTATGETPVTGIPELQISALVVTLTFVVADISTGAGIGAIDWAGTAAGTSVHTGSASGAIAWSGASSGVSTHSGSASGTVAWTGTATGREPAGGSSTGTVTWAGAATGVSPGIGVNEGEATGTIAWTGTATGAVPHRGASSGAVTWTGTAAGAKASNGTASGNVTWTGTAQGVTPAIGVQEGSATGTVTWTGTGQGVSAHRGAATGTVTWTGTAVGAVAHRGACSGTITWAGVASGQVPSQYFYDLSEGGTSTGVDSGGTSTGTESGSNLVGAISGGGNVTGIG